jgi:hypothetical protein
MARIARRTTYAYENLGDGIEIRRRVIAGQQVPDHYRIEGEDVDQVDEIKVSAGYKPEQITSRVVVDKAGVGHSAPPKLPSRTRS